MPIRYLSGLSVDSTVLVVDAANDRVGIGTTSPAETLQVAGNVAVHPGQKFGWIYNPGTDNNIYNYIQTPISGGVAASALEISGSRWTNGNVAGVIFTHQTGGQIMTIMTGGNVGIGTTSPATKLHIHGYTTIDGVDVVAAFSSDNTAKRVNIGYSTSGDYGFINAVHTGVAWKNLILGVSGGNVGIGTTSPAEKLQIAGNVAVHPSQKFGWIYQPGTNNNIYN